MTIGALIRRWGVLVLGVVLVVIGLVVAGSQPVTFGWFAYAPLSHSSYGTAPSPVVAMPTASALMLLSGAVLVSAWVGFRLGRRSPRAAVEL
jgi:heme/copper-type cytochrome/quinol oxidase subunit 1